MSGNAQEPANRYRAVAGSTRGPAEYGRHMPGGKVRNRLSEISLKMCRGGPAPPVAAGKRKTLMRPNFYDGVRFISALSDLLRYLR